MIVSDVCNTLFDSNTTFDFVLFVMKRKQNEKAVNDLYSFRRKGSFLFLQDYLSNKMFNRDFAKSRMISYLSGINKDTLLDFAEQFYEKELKFKRINEIVEKIDEIRNKSGKKLLLASASIDPIIEVINIKIKADGYISSKLGFRDNFCTGKIIFEMKGNKLTEIEKKYPNINNLTVFSDNHSDFELMKKAKERYAISYNKKSNRFWSQLECNLINF